MTDHSHVIRRVILVAALLLPAPSFAAGFVCAPVAESGSKGMLDEPGGVVFNVSDTTYSPKAMQAWLRRLVGKYTYGGFVDLCGRGNVEDQRPVTGKADCIATRSTPNVHCRVSVRWPVATRENGAPVLGGVSNLAPAQFLFSIEIPTRITPLKRGAGVNGWGLVFLQLDNRDTVEWASGVLVGDTFMATERCIDIPGHCKKTTRITVKPDSNEISMLVDIKIDNQRVLRQAFLLHRESNLRNGRQSTGSSP